MDNSHWRKVGSVALMRLVEMVNGEMIRFADDIKVIKIALSRN